MSGTRWVQESVLAARPELDLRVHAVWMPIIGSDSREACDAGLLPDPRVRLYWDEDRLSGRYFKGLPDFGDFDGEVAWDTYSLYGRSARWGEALGPAISAGWPIIQETDALSAAIDWLAGQAWHTIHLPFLTRPSVLPGD